MPENLDYVTTDPDALQLLPESEAAQHGTHLLWSCNVTCPLFTSDSIPSVCCHD